MIRIAHLFQRRPQPRQPIDIEAALRNARPPRDLSPARLAALQIHSKQFKEAQASVAASDLHAETIAAKAHGAAPTAANPGPTAQGETISDV